METVGFQALLQRVRRGDRAAAAEIVRTYEPVLTRMIRVRLVDRRLRRTQGVSDVFQSVMGSFFVRLALGQYDLREPEDLLKLLSVMVRNKVADRGRRRDVARDGEELDASGAAAVPSRDASPSEVVATWQLVEQARSRLPPDLREIIALREDEVGWNEIAARFGANPDALRKRLSRAVEEIAAELGVEDLGT